MKKQSSMSVFDQIKAGLEDSVAYSKGTLSLKTSELPAPPPTVDADDVRALRRSLHMSQAVFAATLNVSPRTIQSWEQGVREPSDAALRMIQIVQVKPEVISEFFDGNGRPAKRASKGRAKRRSAKLAR